MGDWWYRLEYKCQFVFNRRILFSFDPNVGGHSITSERR